MDAVPRLRANNKQEQNFFIFLLLGITFLFTPHGKNLQARVDRSFAHKGYFASGASQAGIGAHLSF
jgi:hypothetical protein